MKLQNIILAILIILQLFMACVALKFIVNRETKITVSIVNYYEKKQYYNQLWYGKKDIEKFIVENNWWLQRFRIAENMYKIDLNFMYGYFSQSLENAIFIIDGVSWYTEIRYQFDVAIDINKSEWEKIKIQIPTRLSNCIVLVRIYF